MTGEIDPEDVEAVKAHNARMASMRRFTGVTPASRRARLPPHVQQQRNFNRFVAGYDATKARHAAKQAERERRHNEGTTLDELCKAHGFRVRKEEIDDNRHLTRSLWWDGAWMGERTTLEALRRLALDLSTMSDDERRARRTKEMDRADRLESKRRPQ